MRRLNPMHDKPIRETVETLTRLYLRGAVVAGLVALALLASAARAAPFDARVVWSREDRAYLVARDSIWVTAGSSLRFFEKKKEVASGVVLLIEDSTLVVAKIATGSLAHVKHLDRIRVEAERATRVALRIGYPSSERIQPFFACRRMTLDSRDYRTDTLSARFYRLVRAPASAGPDTLIVRLFDDSADEEIALERGELDAAVFWPGEPSTHIRQVMSWEQRWSACRYRGVIATRIISPPYIQTDDDYSDFYGLPRRVDRALLDSLNVEFFHDDLREVLGVAFGDVSDAPARFHVDHSVPSHDEFERFLNRRTPRNSTYSYSLSYFDVPTDRDFEDQATRWAFLISCPVISRPELRPYLESIDLSAIVNLFDCETAGRKR